MTRRIIFIIGGAIVFALLVLLLWMWFFSGETALPQPNSQGTFGSANNQQNQPGGQTNTGTNIPSGVTDATEGDNTAASVQNVINGSSAVGSVPSAGSVPTVPGVEWLGGSGSLGGGATTNFVPSGINELNGGGVGGSVSVLGSLSTNQTGTGSGGSGLEGALIGAGVGTALCTAGLVPGALAGIGAGAAVDIGAVPVSPRYSNAALTSNELRENLLNCMTRVIARTALQQMTASIVNWVNSGFNGKPSFVTNYKQFFTNVADQAAGEYIRGSSLAFLCSPFREQIRVAIAQSYAKRNAQSCTLSGVVNNINSFMNGNFNSGGWGGLLSFVNVPTNNPFGAYIYGQGQLSQAIATAANDANRKLTPTGFMSFEEKYDCTIDDPSAVARGAVAAKTNCKTRITTPGGVIENSLSTTLGTSFRQLELAKNFDEIIGALVTQLMTRALQGGLTNLSGSQTDYGSYYLTPDQQQAQSKGQALLENLQAVVRVSEQYGSVWQGAIRDIQTTQEQLNNLANCWAAAASSTDVVSKQNQALANRDAALAKIATYNTQVATYNDKITKANASIAKIQDLQTKTLNVTSTADVNAITAEFNAALAAGTIITQADVTSAQQDRTTLQSALNTQNQQTAAGVQQCYAF